MKLVLFLSWTLLPVIMTNQKMNLNITEVKDKCYSYFYGLSDENSIQELFNNYTKKVSQCYEIQPSLTINRLAFLGDSCHIKAEITSKKESNANLICQDYFMRYFNKIFDVSWGQLNECQKDKIFMNISQSFYVEVQLPHIQIETWFIQVVVYCSINYFKYMRPVLVLCRLTKYGGYSWLVPNQTSCLMKQEFIALINRSDLEIDNKNTKFLKLTLFVKIHAISLVKSIFSEYEINMLNRDIRFAVRHFDYDIGVLLISLVENMAIACRRITTKILSVEFIFKIFYNIRHVFTLFNWTYKNSQRHTLMNCSYDMLYIVERYILISVQLKEIHKFEKLCGACLKLDRAKISNIRHNVYPSCLIYITVGSYGYHSKLAQSVSITFTIIDMTNLVNFSCVRIYNAHVDNSSCILVSNNNLLVTCQCDYVNAVYTVQAQYFSADNEEVKKQPLPEVIEVSWFEILALICGLICLLEYSIIRYTKYLIYYPHVFLYDLQSHFNFLLTHIATMVVRNFLLFRFVSFAGIICKAEGQFLVLLHLFHTLCIVGICVNIFLFLQIPINHFFFKFFGFSTFGIFIIWIYLLSTDFNYTLHVCLPNKIVTNYIVVYPSFVALAFSFILGFLCFFIRGNSFKLELVLLFQDIFLSTITFFLLYQAANELNLLSDAIASMRNNLFFELLIFSIFHVLIKTDIIRFYITIQKAGATTSPAKETIMNLISLKSNNKNLSNKTKESKSQ